MTGTDKASMIDPIAWSGRRPTRLSARLKRALSELERRYSARDTKSELKKFLKGAPRHYVPPDAEIPVDLGVRIADARIGLGVNAGTEPNPWEQEADAAALLRAGIADRAGDEEGERMPELFQWVPWFAELAKKVGEGRRKVS